MPNWFDESGGNGIERGGAENAALRDDEDVGKRAARAIEKLGVSKSLLENGMVCESPSEPTEYSSAGYWEPQKLSCGSWMDIWRLEGVKGASSPDDAESWDWEDSRTDEDFLGDLVCRGEP